jgi:small conductance mechanosensitive channel
MEENMSIAMEMSLRVLSAVIILGAGWIIGKFAYKAIHNYNKFDETLSSFLGGIAKYAVFAFAVVIALGQFGFQTASLIAILGAAGLAIGLAMQGTLSNIAAGVMLLILRPFNVGDYIIYGEHGGTVKSLGLFATELVTPDNVFVFAPNSQVWGSELYNYSRNQQRRQDLNVGISYSDDIDKAMKTIQKVLDKEDRLVRTEGKEPQILTSNMGEFSIDLIVRFWCKAEDYWNLKWDLTKAIKETLEKDGITIPFPTRTVIQQDGEPANDKGKKRASSKTQEAA